MTKASWSKPVVEIVLLFTIGISASYDISSDDNMKEAAAATPPRRRAA